MTACALAKASDGRISSSTAHRLVQRRGVMRYFDSDLLEALCDVLDIKEPGKLLERETKAKGKGKR